MLTYGSLFSGIGGIDLGLDRAGFTCSWQVEINAYCQKVLQKHWPNVTRHGDVRTVGKHNLCTVDLIAGGFPCQDISVAGKRAGITGERSGLWKEFYRIICELRPRYVLVENVPALLHGGIDTVLGDLAACGYDAEWQVLSAEAFGALHLRERVFIVAYPTRSTKWIQSHETMSKFHQWNARMGINGGSNGQSLTTTDTQMAYTSSTRAGMETYRSSGQAWQPPNASQPTLLRQENRAASAEGIRASSADVPNSASERLPQWGYTRLSKSDTQTRARLVFQSQRRSSIEQSDWWAVEPNVGRMAYGVPKRVDRLRGLGNAVVPQIAEYIGRCILARETP